MADRITNDMMSMAKSYNTDTDQKPLMQDKPSPSAYTKPAKNAGHVGSVGDFASNGAANVESVSALSSNKPNESKNKGQNKPLVGAVSAGNEADAAQHSELMQSQRDQNKNLSSIDQSVRTVSSLMHKEAYGPKLDTYERDTEGESVHALAKQLAEQHAETQKALKEIRNAIFGMDGGLLGGLGGGLGFGGGGADSKKNNKKNRSRARPGTRGGPRIRGGGWRGKLLQGALTLGTGLFVGNQIMGGFDSPSESFDRNSSEGKSDTWAGLGSISASNESDNGVRTVSSGIGDHGGVSYGSHQLASETGSMAKFLQSEEGAAFAPAFANMEPGTEQFNRRYSAVADEYEVEFAQAQSNYIKRTHYEPMVDTVKAGTGVDLSKRGPAVQEMLYSTGVQYGPNSDVINRALKDRDVSSMSDSQIINTVQEYKINTTGKYFKSSSKQVQDSVMRRAGIERGQLIALDRQYESGEIDTGASVAAPLMSTSTMVGASLAGTGAYVMSQRQVDQPKIPVSTSDIKDVAGKPTTVRNVAAAANDPVVPKKSIVPKSVRTAASGAADKIPDGVKSAGRTTAKGLTGTGKALRRVPLLGAGLTAIDAYSTVTDDTLTTGEKAGALTDMGGGLVGATVGAKGGALAGAAIGSIVPVVGTAIGGVVGGLVGGTAGYFAGEGITKSAREWVGGLWGDDEEEDNVRTSGSALEGYDNYDAVYDPSVSQVAPSPIAATDASALSPLTPLTPLDKSKGLSPLKPIDRTSPVSTATIAGRTTLSGRSPSQPSEFLSDPKKTTPAKPKKTTVASPAIAGAIAALTSASIIGTAVSAASVAKDYVSKKEAGSESVLDPDFQSKAMAVAAAPVVGAVKGATALYDKFTKAEGDSTTSPKPANAQEILDATPVAATSGKNAIKPASSKSPLADENPIVSSIYSGIISQVFGDEVAQGIKRGGPVMSPLPTYNDVPRTTGPKPIDREDSSSTSVSQVGQKQSQSRSSSAANISTQAVKETPSSRSQYGSVQKVIVVDQTVKKVADKKKLGAPPRTPSAGAFESRSIKPSIDETPAIITDFGLTLLNTGFI